MIDRWGLGTRVPAIIISPFAKRHYVDHTPYETVSILQFIEKRFNLAPLSLLDANPSVNDLTNAFDFSLVAFEPMSVTQAANGETFTLRWTGVGRLETAVSLGGPWINLGATNGLYLHEIHHKRH